ncbi:MAG: hypothetical protein MUF42_08945 [Cytophagaceae bacterium]|jgi:thymidylate kinase|nr:hypothetical protein [Cytophagaceae bacterium]
MKIKTEEIEFLYKFLYPGITPPSGNTNTTETTENYTRHFIIGNRDGSIRWIFPEKLKEPLFLHFYHQGNLRSNIYAWMIRIAFLVGLKRFITHGHVLLPKKGNAIIESIKENTYSIFAGTTGPGRKIIFIEKTTLGNRFYKIPCSQVAKHKLQKEIAFMHKVAKLSPVSFQLPTLQEVKSTGVSHQLQALGKYTCTNQLQQAHFSFVEELYSKTLGIFSIEKSSALQECIKGNLSLLENRNTLKPELIKLHTQIELLRNQWKPTHAVVTALAHGDFTPWNCKIKNSNLYVYDWENALEKAPLFFDLFHFEIQYRILILQEKSININDWLDQLQSHTHIQSLVLKFGIDIFQYFQFYTYIHLSRLIELYQQQEVWHTQVYWQLQCWNSILSQLVPTLQHQPSRRQFLSYFFAAMKDKEYALLKYTGWKIAEFSEHSDLDIVCHRPTFSTIVNAIHQYPGYLRTTVHDLNHMWVIQVFFQDGNFIEIDLISSCKYKHLKFLEISEILDSAGCTEEGIKVAQPHYNMEYLLGFFQLNRSSIPLKYKNYFEQLQAEVQKNAYEYIYQKYQLPIDSSIFTPDPKIRALVVQFCDKKNKSIGWTRAISYLTYVLYVWRRLRAYRGKMITFSGVDGAGKSTILYKFSEVLQQKYRKRVVIYRHRPGLFPILSSLLHGKKKAEAIASHAGPHAGNNQSTLSSLLRFMYYLCDYIIGLPYIWMKHILKGEIVLFDRFYFDFISDPERSNVTLPSPITRLFLPLFNVSSLNFLLYAPSETILKRKQELSQREIELLTQRYLKLFDTLSDTYKNKSYCSIQNIELETTLHKIQMEYHQRAY